MIQVNVKLPNLDSIRKRLGEHENLAPEALRRGINNSMRPINRGIAKIAGQRYTYRPDGLKAPRQIKATKKALSGELTYTGKGIPIDRFKISQGSQGYRSIEWTYMTETPGTPLRVQVRKGKYLTIRNAFLINWSGGRKVFHRPENGELSDKISARLKRTGIMPTRFNAMKLDRLYSSSVPMMVSGKHVKADIQKIADDELRKSVAKTIEKILIKARS